MIIAAIQHELRRLRRSPARLVTLVLFLAIGSYSVFAAKQSAETWQETIDAALDAERESVTKVRAWFKEGQKGPADRPWVNIAQPRFMDYYAGTRIARAPAPLAGISGGVGSEMPVVVLLRRTTDPFGVAGAEIENPEFDRSRGLDLTFLLIVLAPLVLGILSFGIGSQEREGGFDALLAVQTGNPSSWYLARALAATLISVSAVALLVGLAILVLRPGFAAGAAFFGIAVLHTLLWGALHTLVAVTCRRVREAAVAYGLLWTVLCLLIPAGAAEWAVSGVADDFAMDLSLNQRRGLYESFQRKSDALLPELYEAFPELSKMPAAKKNTLPPLARRELYTGLRLLELEKRHRERLIMEGESWKGTGTALWLSPVIAARLGTERLAGADVESAVRFRGRVVRAVRERATWALSRTWEDRALTASDFEALVGSEARVLEIEPPATSPHLLVLAIWTLLAWALGVAVVWRQGR